MHLAFFVQSCAKKSYAALSAELLSPPPLFKTIDNPAPAPEKFALSICKVTVFFKY
jgi:hypothetical protein